MVGKIIKDLVLFPYNLVMDELNKGMLYILWGKSYCFDSNFSYQLQLQLKQKINYHSSATTFID